jgi:hypothetical protein
METLDVFATSVTSLDESCIKNEQQRICRSLKFFNNFYSHHFSGGRVLMVAGHSEKEV